MKWWQVACFGAVVAACGGEDDAVSPTTSVTQPPRATHAPTPDPGGGGAPGPRPLLPDLQVSEPRELYIQYGEDGIREIRFSTTIANLGDGPLHMVGAFDEGTGAVSTIQLVALADGTTREIDVGRFVFDDGHDHWHLEDFIVFELLELRPDGTPGRVLETTGKMTFCLADSYPVAESPPNAAPNAGVTSCDQEIQGISVGWADIYVSELPGQELDIPELPDGRYGIRSTVDPVGLLLETDDNNNSTVNLVEISGDAISYVE
jgi:hypothetical protein